MQPQHVPTPERDDATTARHYQDGPEKVGVGCLIKVVPALPGKPGKHALIEDSAVAS